MPEKNNAVVKGPKYSYNKMTNFYAIHKCHGLKYVEALSNERRK